MNLRTIMIFPQFENMEVINQIRNQYDPLVHLVNPHITIVFPFKSEISNEDLRGILDRRLDGMKPFHLELKGFSKEENEFGKYLFLNIEKGKEYIEKMHQILYEHEFNQYYIGFDYVPHMTVGKLEDTRALEEAYNKIKDNNSIFKTTVNKICVEMIGDHDESIIIIEKQLS